MRIDFIKKTISVAIVIMLCGLPCAESGARQVDEQPGNHA